MGYENLVDWSQYFSDEELASYIPEFIAEGKTPDDRFVVFPVSKSTYALYLNGSQFEKFSQATGVTYESLSTWEGFFDAAEKYYNYSGGKPFCAFDYLIRHVELDMLSNGSEVVYTETGWYDIENPALKEAWMMFADALVQGHVIVSDLYANTQVMTGDVLGGIGSSAAIIYFNDTVTYPDNTQEPTNLHALPLPMSAGDVHFMPQTGVGMAAYYTTDQKAEAASVFMRWFTEGARNLDFVAETGYMPVQVSAYDAIDSYAFPNEGYHSLYQAIDVMRQTTTPIIRPTVNGYYKKTNALYDGLRQMQQTWPDRLQDGASKESLMNESWDFFCSIGDDV